MEENATMSARLLKAWVWADANRMRLIWIGVVGAFAVLVASYFWWSQGQKQVTASAALLQVAADQAFQKEGFSDAATAYLKVSSDYAGTKAAGLALLQAGVSLFEEGKYPEAHTQFQRFAREYSSNPFLPQAMLGMAACLDAEGKTNEAAQAYKNVSERFSDSNVAPQAKFALARIYESQNKLKDASTLYEEIVRLVGLNSSIGSEAGIRGAELERDHPELAPKPVAANTPPPGLTTSVLTNLMTAKTNQP